MQLFLSSPHRGKQHRLHRGMWTVIGEPAGSLMRNLTHQQCSSMWRFLDANGLLPADLRSYVNLAHHNIAHQVCAPDGYEVPAVDADALLAGTIVTNMTCCMRCVGVRLCVAVVQCWTRCWAWIGTAMTATRAVLAVRLVQVLARQPRSHPNGHRILQVCVL